MGPEQGNEAAARLAGRIRALKLAVLLLGFLCGATATLDMDFHWHLALGQGLVTRGFPQAEPFSHLPVGAPDRQAWLSDAAFAILDRIGGLAAIRVVLGAVFAAGCLSVLRLGLRRTSSLALALLPLAVYFALSMARLRVRPDLFTLALVPLFAEMLDRPPSWRRAIELLVVSALWANLHPGSLIAGLLALAQIWPLTPLRFANLGATAIGLCLTPDGIRGLLRFTADTTPLRPLIPEWQRLWERPFAEFWPEWGVVLGILAACVAAILVGLRPGAPPPQLALRASWGPRPAPRPAACLLRAVFGLLLAASAVRFLFALFLPVLWAVLVLDRVRVRRAQLCAAAWVASVLLFLAFPGAHLKRVADGLRVAGWGLLGADPPAFPLEAATYLAGSALTGNLAHPASWGGYLAWKLAPRFRTATDGRVTHFGAEIAREWSEGVSSPSREEIFARRGIDLIVVPRTALSSFRDDQPYTPIYGDSFASILLCLNGPHAAENRAVLKEQLKEELQRKVGQPR
jgi:hypothetical protein